MNLALVVEGTFDGPTYRTLISRVRDDISELQVRECGGKSRLKHKFVYFLKELQRNSAWQIDVAFVIRDSDCDPPQPIENQLTQYSKHVWFRTSDACGVFRNPMHVRELAAR